MEHKDEHISKQGFKQLLERLQQDSWQLELLISGFVIFLLIGAEEGLSDLLNRSNFLISSFENGEYFLLPLAFLYVGWLFLLCNLILHVLLRGLWISTIGLRYVSGDIEFDSFKYRPKFVRYLKRRIGSFDHYIERLEDLCSVIFAFTFLIVFIVISLSLFLFIVIFSGETLNHLADRMDGGAWRWLFRLPVFLLLFSGLIYFFDFITQGLLKRSKWLGGIYYPIYWVMSLLTLSFIYRPMYYNLIDNKFGRRVGFLLVPYIVLALFIFSIQFETHPFFPESYAEDFTFDQAHYEDLREEENYITKASIPSKYVENGFLEVFIPYVPKSEDSILHRICPEFIPHKKNRVRTSMVNIVYESTREISEKSDSAFQCLTQLYRIQINDSLYQDLDYLLYDHGNFIGRGLKTILDVQYLARGPHRVEILRQHIQNGGKPGQFVLGESGENSVLGGIRYNSISTIR